ncbi:hypothetical protein DER44DRAFT_857578 [Fusarium oxysporum]|nr:hypothetical protein DER44DRAFT_857578 [Fusarium oxysporum]
MAGAGMLTTAVAFNALSDHGTCTMVFVAVACALAFVVGTGFRALEKVAWISWVGVGCIFAAIWTIAIACLTQDHPAVGPQTGPIDLDIQVLPKTTFTAAMTAISNQLFAVGASGVFFSITVEMKEPQKFTRSLIWGQGFIVLTCIAIASIIYGKASQYLENPALGSAGPLMKRISYGIALPGLLVTVVLYTHIAANTVKHWMVWIGSMFVTAIFAFVVVGVVPFFGSFLSLVGALVNPIFTNILPGFMLLFYVAKQPVKVGDEGK